MKQSNLIFLIFLVIPFSYAFAQENISHAIALDSVFLQQHGKLADFYAYAHQIIDKDSLKLERLSDALKNKSSVFVREYGYGMLSSLSLRGTGAGHTQILWNGIPVNSVLNGQTDLNTVNINNYEQIILKKGGSSVEYGSGAIGGILALNNSLVFKPVFEINNTTNGGSFGHFENFTRLKIANQKYYGSVAFQTGQSENDYPYVGYELTNENAAYKGYNYNLVAGYKLNTHHQIYFKSQNDHLDRELARTLYMSENSKLITSHNRNLTGWIYQHTNFKLQTDLAYLFEAYDYYADKSLTKNPDRSIATVFVVKNIFSWKKNHFYINWGNHFSYQEGKSHYFELKTRKIYALYVDWGQKWNKFKYNLKLRKDFEKNYDIPLIGAVEAGYKTGKYFLIRGNISKNYKLPTFNDLYWQPYGNPDLQPEESYTYEGGLDFLKNNTQVSLTGFYIKSQNLIKWTPGENQWWSPKNIANATYRGIEINFRQKYLINKLDKILFNLDFTYQKTTDLNTQKYIPYTPLYVGLAGLEYQHQKLKIKYTSRINGKIYTTSSNTTYIPAVNIQDISLFYQLKPTISLGGNIDNIFNVYYETFPSRPEPGINYNLYINFKIK